MLPIAPPRLETKNKTIIFRNLLFKMVFILEVSSKIFAISFTVGFFTIASEKATNIPTDNAGLIAPIGAVRNATIADIKLPLARSEKKEYQHF